MTKKELKNMGLKICRAGVYGWNWSAYLVPTTNGAPVIVCTGYRDLVGERVDGVAAFEEKASAIYNAGEGWQTTAEKQRANAIALGDYIASRI